MTHPEALTYKLPDNMNTMEGALVEPAAVGMHAAMEADVKPEKKIVILGAGCIGLMTLQACRVMGAAEIVVSDVIDKRLNMAKRLGADIVFGDCGQSGYRRPDYKSGDAGRENYDCRNRTGRYSD